MRVLAFDTSNNGVSVAISYKEKIIAYRGCTSSIQAEKLIPLIEETLKLAQLKYTDLDFIAVINGPGSFTGIRVGLAAAKALTFHNNIEFSVVSNFEISFYKASQQVKTWDEIIVILNAYRNQLYVKSYYKDGRVSEDLLLDYQEVINLVDKAEGKVICVGNGIELIYKNLQFPIKVTILPRYGRIKASHICNYIYYSYNFRKKKPIEPLYIRHIDAKIPNKI